MNEETIYAIIYGNLDKGPVGQIIRRMTDYSARQTPPKRIIIQYSVPGGEVNSSIILHDFFSGYSIPITAYSSCAMSGGAIALLGIKDRKISPHGKFMIHGVLTRFPADSSIDELRRAIGVASIDDDRMKSIITQNLKDITRSDWIKYRAGAFHISGKRLVSCGVITGETDHCYLPVLPVGARWEELFIDEPK